MNAEIGTDEQMRTTFIELCLTYGFKVDAGEEFDRWLKAHDRDTLAATALRFESADYYEAKPHKASDDLIEFLREVNP